MAQQQHVRIALHCDTEMLSQFAQLVVQCKATTLIAGGSDRAVSIVVMTILIMVHSGPFWS